MTNGGGPYVYVPNLDSIKISELLDYLKAQNDINQFFSAEFLLAALATPD